MRSLLFKTDGPAALILIRILVEWVFLSEGIGKFLYPAEQRAARFKKIPGSPAPHISGPFVGGVEIVCGVLPIIGLLTRLSVIPLLIDLSVAILTTKIPILQGHSYTVPKLAHYNLWAMLHEAGFLNVAWTGFPADCGRWPLVG